MIDFIYTAKDKESGQLVKASVKAESPEAAAKLLVKQNLFPLEITTKSEANPLKRIGIGDHVSLKNKVLFTRQLSTLINAGLPLNRALHTAQEQVGNQKLNEVIGSVIASVEGGTALSAAFAQHPKVFNQIYVAIVSAGEASGSLDKALLRLADQLEKDSAVISKVRSALVYPAIVLVLIVVVVGLMVTTVVPEVAKLYKDLHKDLPFLTIALVVLSNFLLRFWWLVLILMVPVVFGVRALLSNEKALYEVDRLKMRIPLFGKIYKKLYMARFARTMNSLLASGIPMLDAMQTTRQAIANRVLADDMDGAIKEVKGGKSLSAALQNSDHFLDLVPQMTKIGEESGAIDDMLGRTATYYENEVDEAVKNLSTTLEPIMIVVLGGIVALVLLAVLWPVYSLVGAGGLQ